MAMQVVPDPKIQQNVVRQLSRCIRAPSRVTVTSRRGEVTLAGTVQYEHQRQSASRAVQSVEGVRRVIDQMTVKPAARRW